MPLIIELSITICWLQERQLTYTRGTLTPKLNTYHNVDDDNDDDDDDDDDYDDDDRKEAGEREEDYHHHC